MFVHDDPKYQSGPPPGPESAPPNVIISPDTMRAERIPPGQSRTRKWPVLQYGLVPNIDRSEWRLTIDGLVEHPFSVNWEEFQQLPRVRVFSDFHCVTRWSRLGNVWEGVSVKEILRLAAPRPDVRYVIAQGYDDGWTTNLPFEHFAVDDALLVDRHDGQFLDADHGGPVRLVIPRLYAWKSAKWLRGLRFVAEDEPGFWERDGYHLVGDPWTVNDAHPDGERFRDDPGWCDRG